MDVNGFVSALIGAVAGGLFVLWGTRMAAHSEGKLARQQWDRERKSETYRRLVSMMIRYRQRYYLTNVRTGEVSEYAPELPHEDDWLAMNAEVEIFASPAVQELVEDFRVQKINLSMTIADGDQSGPRPEAHDLREDAAKLCTAIIDQAKRELAPID